MLFSFSTEAGGSRETLKGAGERRGKEKEKMASFVRLFQFSWILLHKREMAPPSVRRIQGGRDGRLENGKRTSAGAFSALPFI